MPIFIFLVVASGSEQIFWGIYMMQNFRPIDWHHSLLPIFFVQLFGILAIFLFSYLAHNSKTAHFKVWFPIGLSIQFFVLDILCKNSILAHQSSFPFSSYVDRRFVLEKPVASVNFLFHAKMADGTVDVDMLLLCVCMCNGCYSSFLKLQTTYEWRCKVQPTCKEERIGIDPSLLSVEIAVRITG